MKKPRVVFRHFAGSGPLSIYWHDGPYGDAVEAIKGRGVAWLAPNGELLGVELDDVTWVRDEQSLELPNPAKGSLRSFAPALDPPFREGDGNVGIIRSPTRAIALPDLPAPSTATSAPIARISPQARFRMTTLLVPPNAKLFLSA